MLYTIEDILEEMVIENKRNFSPHYICNRSGIKDIKLVTECLFDLVGKKLSVFYEVECPEGDSDFEIKSLSDLPQEIKICHICGVEYKPNIERIWVGFNFLPEYIFHVKKKKSLINTKQLQLLM